MDQPTPQCETWPTQRRREAWLRYLLCRSRPQTASELGCGLTELDHNLPAFKEPIEISLADLLTLFEHFDTERNLSELLTAKSGSIEQARLRAALRARTQLHIKRRSTEMPAPTHLKSLAQLEEMSGDELRDYMASLVPGLEHKARLNRQGPATPQNASLPADRETSAKATDGKVA